MVTVEATWSTVSRCWTASATGKTPKGTDSLASVLAAEVPGHGDLPPGCQVQRAVLSTALAGSTIKVMVVGPFFVSLKDNDPDATNPYVVKANINKGNLQIAHGINRVLRPVDL